MVRLMRKVVLLLEGIYTILIREGFEVDGGKHVVSGT